MTAPSKTFRAAALFAAASLALTGCAAASSDTVAAPAAEPAVDEQNKTPQENANAFHEKASMGVQMGYEFTEKYMPELDGSPRAYTGDRTDPSMVNIMLYLVYGGFPEHQKASFEWSEDEVKRVSDAFAPYLYDEFEADFADALRKSEGGLILTTASTVGGKSNPKAYTAADGNTCTLTDDPWDVKFGPEHGYLEVGPDVSTASGEVLPTIRLDYSTTFIIKCADGKTMTVSQPKHLGFVEQGEEWLLHEYGREDHPTVEFQPAS